MSPYPSSMCGPTQFQANPSSDFEDFCAMESQTYPLSYKRKCEEQISSATVPNPKRRKISRDLTLSPKKTSNVPSEPLSKKMPDNTLDLTKMRMNPVQLIQRIEEFLLEKKRCNVSRVRIYIPARDPRLAAAANRYLWEKYWFTEIQEGNFVINLTRKTNHSSIATTMSSTGLNPMSCSHIYATYFEMIERNYV